MTLGKPNSGYKSAAILKWPIQRISYLWLSEASEAKHSNLIRDMAPVSLGSFSLQVLPQFAPHRNNSVRHPFDFCEPLRTRNTSFLQIFRRPRPRRPFASTYHSAFNDGSDKILVTILAPWIGGFEYMALIMIFNCAIRRAASSLLSANNEKAPTRSPATPKSIVTVAVGPAADNSSSPGNANRTIPYFSRTTGLMRFYGHLLWIISLLKRPLRYHLKEDTQFSIISVFDTLIEGLKRLDQRVQS